MCVSGGGGRGETQALATVTLGDKDRSHPPARAGACRAACSRWATQMGATRMGRLGWRCAWSLLEHVTGAIREGGKRRP